MEEEQGQEVADHPLARAGEDGGVAMEVQGQEEEAHDGDAAMRGHQEEEGGGGEEEGGNSPPPRVVSPEMQLTEQEENWAWDLIQRVEAPHLGMKPLSDYEYVVYALVTKGDIPEALRMITGIQHFREAYDVQDSVEQGMAALSAFIRLQPGALIHVDVMGHHGGVVAWDWGRFVASRVLKTEENWKTYILTLYYLSRMQGPTLQSVREGTHCLIEGSMTWECLNMTVEERLHEEFFAFDAIKYKKILVYSTNSIANIAFSLMKPLMSEEKQRVIQLGCQIEDETLNPFGVQLKLGDFYLQPTYDAAMHNMQQRARTLLETWVQNNKTYQLI